MLQFVSSLPIEDTMIFEASYEENLQLEADDKRPILANGIAAWLLVDGKVAGETYGITPRSLAIVADDEIEDCDPEDDASIYCYSTTILPEFRGKGLARLLKAYWLGKVAERGFGRVVGHSTSSEIMHINHVFGARDLASHENWYKTSRTATFYEITLDNTKTVQASAGDCGATVIEYLVRSLGRVSQGRARMIEIGGATDRDGMSHDGLKAVLRAHGLAWVEHIGPVQDAPPLSIVNYLWEGDGHYGVLVKKADPDVFIFNPAFGTIDHHEAGAFNDLFSSPRYPPARWALSVTQE
jgi:GNAT superfamily N-acetyltransferase